MDFEIDKVYRDCMLARQKADQLMELLRELYKNKEFSDDKQLILFAFAKDKIIDRAGYDLLKEYYL